VSSTATVLNGVVYVGGGAQYWYALDASNGNILWQVFTGDNSSNGGYYNWASPLIVNGAAYINISSAGNCPSVQGAVMKVDLATHNVTHTFYAVPNGQVGGAIWSSPAYDASTDTVFVTTGSVIGVPFDTDQPQAQAIVSLHGSDLSMVDSWQIPQAQDTGDSDFGTTPTLFTDGNGRQLIGAANKNGIFYALDRNALSAGPVWQSQLAEGGSNPAVGQGSISSAAFDGTTLYVAAGTPVNGANYASTITAFDPANGNIKWQQGANGYILGALAVSNGLLVDASGQDLEVRSTVDGSVLFSSTINNNANVALSAGPIIANGVIYEGSVDGNVYAFGL
jgi:outer membrane protein assembly factor BamB